MKIAFLGFDQWQGKFNIGSSRIRCDWPIKYWQEAERFKQGRYYDVIIFQKAYWIDYAKTYKGIKILDICDPDWMEAGSRVIEMMQYVDAITTSSIELAKAAVHFTNKPIWFIPDRIDLDSHRDRKEHTGRAKSVVWFGYSHNFPTLHQATKPLIDLGLDLIVISDSPFHPAANFVNKIDITNIAWGPNTVNRDILRGDIVINPKLSTGRFKFKSTNKTLTSWALGMPVVENDKELKFFLEEKNRKDEAAKRLVEIKEKWDVKYSVEEYKKLINDLILKSHETKIA
ncbi:MAG: hypothetical protein UV20_C0009G0036 [Candidatus Magasanikbacteria bacterium GW2011_GWA2_42_32]|uniref:Glycosyltransferase n=1 Tax=Candidatus Magasanikbacteria bacterium GW2011_GWA2_42_32 TaxID=1619039 RepID=A0A0G1A648_9BACT|nr:MAG: hypothetical protein UV20_C0009G0036 [Candidatus Magasanikbacteria bacterium GW2011_GWA2_42_32]HBX15888.1 hypothetical protein [Candidatus Magasanikbacteria bacterium]